MVSEAEREKNKKVLEGIHEKITSKIRKLSNLEPQEEIILFLGAGASTDFGPPLGSNLIDGLPEEITDLFKKIKKEIDDENKKDNKLRNYQIEEFLQSLLDIENLHTSIEGQKLIKLIEYPIFENIKKITDMRQKIYEHIRRKCRITTDKVKLAVDTLGRLINTALKKNIRLRIFTTNYDDVIEIISKNLKFDFDDGFCFYKYEGTQIWENKFCTGDKKFDYFKLHGSIDWYSDKSGTIRMIPTPHDLEATIPDWNATMIYPTTVKGVYTEPFASLFAYYEEFLSKSREIVVIGYSFRDENIVTPLKKHMENTNSKLVIISPDASNIINTLLKEVNWKVDKEKIEGKDLTLNSWINDKINEWEQILDGIVKKKDDRERLVKEAEKDLDDLIIDSLENAFRRGRDSHLGYIKLWKNHDITTGSETDLITLDPGISLVGNHGNIIDFSSSLGEENLHLGSTDILILGDDKIQVGSVTSTPCGVQGCTEIGTYSSKHQQFRCSKHQD